jgi:Fungal specific transcription factor domain
MLGVAIRIAKRMGVHNESALAKCTALEAEMRRRLWWSLVLFDTRIGELANYKDATLAPTWDCKIPLNVNDSDLRLDMKEAPHVQGRCTEAIFAVVRGELGDFVRHTMFHLDITNPAMKSIAKDFQHGHVSEDSELVSLEKTIEDKFFRFCDPENPIHFMTIWTTRAYLAKCRLMEYLSRHHKSTVYQTEAQHDAVMSCALSMLECDTKIMTSPLTRGFLWLAQFYFPFPAYIQIVQNLKRRPVSNQAEKAWEVMSDNYEARFGLLSRDDIPAFESFTKIVLMAWEAREAAFKKSGDTLVTARIVSLIRHNIAELSQDAPNIGKGQPRGATDMGINVFPLSMSMGFGFDMSGQAPLDVDVNHLDWSAMDWDLVNTPAEEAGSSADKSLRY